LPKGITKNVVKTKEYSGNYLGELSCNVTS